VNAEALYFTALLRSGRLAAFRGLERDHLSPPYQPVYDFLREFVREHAALPQLETGTAKFFGAFAPDAPEDPVYYLGAIRDNAMRLALEVGLRDEVAPHLIDARPLEALDATKRIVTDINRTFVRDDDGALLGDLAERVQDRMAAYELRARAGGAVGFPTPWGTLNRFTGGLQPGEAAAILSRPGQGKTWAMLVWATYLRQHGFRVLFVSMETPPEAPRPRATTHRVVGRQCFWCFETDVSPSAQCSAVATPRQLLTMRFDAVGARVSALRFVKGRLQPIEHERLQRYYAASATHNNGKWGALRIVAPPRVRTMSDIDIELAEFRPDACFVDSAYLAMERTARPHEAASQLVWDFKSAMRRTNTAGAVSWHFNREVDEDDEDASMNCAALTDEMPRVFDWMLGLFRPPKLKMSEEALWRVIKLRDAAHVTGWRSAFALKERLDFRELAEDVPAEAT
jgi:hypothetical protein